MKSRRTNQIRRDYFNHWGEVTPVQTHTHVHRLVCREHQRRKLGEVESRIGRVWEFQRHLVQHFWCEPGKETKWPALSWTRFVCFKFTVVFCTSSLGTSFPISVCVWCLSSGLYNERKYSLLMIFPYCYKMLRYISLQQRHLSVDSTHYTEWLQIGI